MTLYWLPRMRPSVRAFAGDSTTTTFGAFGLEPPALAFLVRADGAARVDRPFAPAFVVVFFLVVVRFLPPPLVVTT
jgi:hypothetical protein